MSRKDKRARHDRLAALLASGAHAQAARAARETLADPGASEEERARAGEVLASLAPERFAMAAGLAGVVVAILLTIWVGTGGAR